MSITKRTAAVAITTAVGLLAVFLLAGCGSDPDTTATTSGPAGTVANSPTQTPPPESWTKQKFDDPVLESDADAIPFTQMPINPKGELIPPNTRLDAPVMWQAIGCQALAFSSDAGPTTRTPGGWPAGWARTDKGAALAAWSIAILFEVMPDRGEFTRSYVADGTDTFIRTSEQRDPRAGVRAAKWKDSARCFRTSTTRRVDLDVSASLADNNTHAAVRFYSPKYKVTWDFPLVWDEDSHDWKATTDGLRQYWQTVDNPTERPITTEFTW